MYGVSNSASASYNPKKRPISEVVDNFEDRVDGSAFSVLEHVQKNYENVSQSLKKIKNAVTADADEVMDMTDPRAQGLLVAIRDKGLSNVQREVDEHNQVNEMITKVLTKIHSLDSSTPILRSILPESRDAAFYKVGMHNAQNILESVQGFEVQNPGGSAQFIDAALNLSSELNIENSEDAIASIIDFVEDITESLQNFNW